MCEKYTTIASDLAAALDDAASTDVEAVELAADALAEAAATLEALAALADEAAPRLSPHPGSAKAAAPSTAAPVRLKKERLVNIV